MAEYAPFLVYWTAQIEEMLAFYTKLGLRFEHHTDHGPAHYAATIDGLTFELYPAQESRVMLGFQAQGLARIVEEFKGTGMILKDISPAARRAILVDPDGHKVFLGE